MNSQAALNAHDPVPLYTWCMTIGARLKLLRSHYGITQDDVASTCGVSKSMVSQWETNLVSIPTDRVIALRGKYPFSCDWLFFEEGYPPSGIREPVRALLRVAQNLPDYAVVELTREGDTYAKLIAQGPARENGTGG